MANTYTQLYLHFVFAVKFRAALIDNGWNERLHNYITAIVQNNGHKMLAINTMPDHLHMFIGLNPNQSISDLIRIVKSDSSEWINKNKFTNRKFNWQSGYGSFSYARSQINNVVLYIRHQQDHHNKINFINEYKRILDRFEVTYKSEYIFKEIE
jgi:putative transposase